MASRLLSLCSSALLLLAACGSNEPGATLGEPGDAGAVDRTIEVDADEFEFTPDEIEVSPGETIEFVVTNAGQVQHEFSIGTDHAHHSAGEHGAATGSTGPIDPGDSATLVWSFPDEGETEFACHIDSHDAQGMVGTLTVAS